MPLRSLLVAQNTGDLKLPNDGAGPLQIYMSGRWGTISAVNFTKSAADVTCHQLGYSGAKTFSSTSRTIMYVNWNPWTWYSRLLHILTGLSARCQHLIYHRNYICSIADSLREFLYKTRMHTRKGNYVTLVVRKDHCVGMMIM